MKEEKEIKIKLSTAITGILVLIIIALGIAVAFLYKQNMEMANPQSEAISTSSTETNTAPVTQKIEEKKAEKPLTEDEGLKDFLGYMGYLNVYKDNNDKKEIGANDKIMLASMYTKKERKSGYVTYNLKDIKEAIKEIFNEEIDVEKNVKARKCTIFYDSKIDAYIDGGGDESYSVYLVKIESQTNSSGIYEFTFLYGYPSEGDFLEKTYGECDCFRTTVKIKVNENYRYSKYQLVSSELAGKKVGKIKDFIKNQ